jgi:heme/copper-type cytochrome/quinol oxidase subunit 3
MLLIILGLYFLLGLIYSYFDVIKFNKLIDNEQYAKEWINESKDFETKEKRMEAIHDLSYTQKFVSKNFIIITIRIFASLFWLPLMLLDIFVSVKKKFK